LKVLNEEELFSQIVRIALITQYFGSSMIIAILFYLAIFLLLLALEPLVDFRLFFLRSFSTEHIILWGGVVSPMPNPKPGGPECSFLSGSFSLTSLSWETLPLVMLPPA
jgi:hypothetical protein